MQDQIAKCWNPPPSMSAEFEGLLHVELDAAGYVQDVTAKSFAPDDANGREAVMASVRAIERCGPYEGGNFDVVMPPPYEPIDPFKP